LTLMDRLLGVPLRNAAPQPSSPALSTSCNTQDGREASRKTGRQADKARSGRNRQISGRDPCFSRRFLGHLLLRPRVHCTALYLVHEWIGRWQGDASRWQGDASRRVRMGRSTQSSPIRRQQDQQPTQRHRRGRAPSTLVGVAPYGPIDWQLPPPGQEGPCR